MTRDIYGDNYGDEEAEDLCFSVKDHFKFLLIKFKRMLKEALLFQSFKELKQPEV